MTRWLTAAAAQTGGCSRPVCRRRPWPAPWRAGDRGAHRKAALLSWRAARERTPGRRNDRRRPMRSAAWWGLSLQSMSPSFASCLRLSGRLASASALTAQHNTYPGFSVPHSGWCTPRAKTTRRPSVTTTVASRHTVPAPHRYAGAVPVAHRHRVSLAGDVPRYPRLMHWSWSVWDFRLAGRVALPGTSAPERYYFR